MIMNRILALLLSMLLLSCCHHPAGKKTTPQPQPQPKPQPVEQVPAAPSSFIMDLKAEGDSAMLSKQLLTGSDGFDHAFGYDKEYEGYFEEATRPEETFYFPADDLRRKNPALVATVQQSWNYSSLLNRVIHAYDLFLRASTDYDLDEGEEKLDTLAFIKKYAPRFSDQFLTKAFPNEDTRREAKKLLAAFRKFDGDDSEDAPFTKAIHHYADFYNTLPRVASKEMIDRFEKDFWPWYDKTQFVPEADTLCRMHLEGAETPNLTDEEFDHFNRVVASQTDIDKRAVLALECAKFDCCDGAFLLGDIIESCQYTRYLLECWISWRANAQITHSPSSMSVIANNYYDKVRVICIDTMLRQAIEHNDTNALCLLQNLIVCQALHRQGSILGNESMVIRLHLNYVWFIHPRLLSSNN